MLNAFSKMRQSDGARNFTWLFCDKVLRLGIGLLVSVWAARQLGVLQFGQLAYAQTWIAIAGALAGLGFEGVVVRHLIRRPAEAGMLIGTTVAFRIGAAAMATALSLGVVAVIRPTEQTLLILVSMLGVGLCVQAAEIGELWFHARLEARKLIPARLALLSLFGLAKVLTINHGGGVVSFAAISGCEAAAGGMLTLAMLRRAKSQLPSLYCNLREGFALVQQCWPLWLSGLMVMIYTKTSQIILASVAGDAEVAIYHAAVRLSEATYFLPGMLSMSFLPSLLKSRDRNPSDYAATRMRFLRVNALMGYCIAAPLSFSAPWMIQLLYGAEYSASSPVLAVHAWTILFCFMGVARGQHLLNEGNGIWAMKFTVWGMILNILANIILIPRFGALGAALGVLAAQMGATLAATFAYAATRAFGFEQVTSLLTPWRLRDGATAK